MLPESVGMTSSLTRCFEEQMTGISRAGRARLMENRDNGRPDQSSLRGGGAVLWMYRMSCRFASHYLAYSTASFSPSIFPFHLLSSKRHEPS